MSQDLKNVGPNVHVATIVNHGEKMILPEGMGLNEAIEVLERRKVYMQEKVILRETFDVFPWDGAYALQQLLEKKYGWAQGVKIPGGWFSPDKPPQLISVEIAYGVQAQVPWGRFEIPGVVGWVACDTGRKNGRIAFELQAQVLRVDEGQIKELFADLRQYLKEYSIYRGKAIKVRFRDEDGDPLSMPEPKFMDTDDVDTSMLIYSKDLQDSIETNLFTPITRVADCIANGLNVKRGILLGGTYGTGKSLAAKVASKHAVAHGITYIYVPRADELSDAIEFAKQYQSPASVVFCEDIDRALSGERDVEMDDILNILDGIDTKSSNIITVLTTNDLDSLNPAILRPGRLDAVIEVTTPDAEAVERLLRYYGGNAIPASVDLTEAGKALSGAIPAVIHEVVKRAKLSQLRLQAPGEPVKELSEKALIEAAKTMSSQLALLKARSEAGNSEPTVDQVVRRMLSDAVEGAVENVGIKVRQVLNGD